jgi:membrane-associated phospholipid phosphatase
VHYPFDIIGSILVAAAVSGLIFLFRKKIERLNSLIIHLYDKLFRYEK